jgi:DNA-binding Lrp family transcriptional regulator
LKYHKSSEQLVTIAYVLLKTDLGSEENVIDELKKLEQIKRVERTFGDYDMVVKMEAEHIEKIREVIAWNIQKMAKVRATRTLVKKEQN